MIDPSVPLSGPHATSALIAAHYGDPLAARVVAEVAGTHLRLTRRTAKLDGGLHSLGFRTQREQRLHQYANWAHPPAASNHRM